MVITTPTYCVARTMPLGVTALVSIKALQSAGVTICLQRSRSDRFPSLFSLGYLMGRSSDVLR